MYMCTLMHRFACVYMCIQHLHAIWISDASKSCFNNSLGSQSYHLQMKVILPPSLQYLDTLFNYLAHRIDKHF